MDGCVIPISTYPTTNISGGKSEGRLSKPNTDYEQAIRTLDGVYACEVRGKVGLEEGLDVGPDAHAGALVVESVQGVAFEDCDADAEGGTEGEEGQGAEEAGEGCADLDG